MVGGRAWPAILGLLLIFATTARADKLVLKEGKVVFGTVTDERDSVIKYLDRYDRPRKLKAAEVDTLHYDSKAVAGRVKVAFRKGQPKDRSGYFRLKHSEELDLDVEYATDSIAELDLFFRNQVHVRVLPGTRFRVVAASADEDDPVELEVMTGRVLATATGPLALVRVATPGGIGVGRGTFQLGVRAEKSDSSLLVTCLRGLCGAQASRENPGELVVEPGRPVSLVHAQGTFEPRDPDPAEVELLRAQAANVGHYRFSAVEYPKIGYLPKAITGFGFMVFFYGTAIGILDYVNNI